MKTETPRTDNEAYSMNDGLRRRDPYGSCVDSAFARQLERENNALLKALELFIEPGDSERLRIARAAIALAKEEQQ